MKISRIEFENFRNYKEYGCIECSTDGRATIIYGKNGDGKTTLHQLLQWIFYGEVHFNKTTTNILYNLKAEEEKEYDESFIVMGRVDFEHNREKFSLTRTNTYKKKLTNSELVKEEISLNKMDDEYNWKRIDNPTDMIEKILPSGLAEYFFFDGESMIADLRVKGRDSASKLKRALFSMFDLDIIESAKSHIGSTELKTTVLGKLYLSKGTIASDSEISAVQTNIENAQNKINDFKGKIAAAEKGKRSLRNKAEKISETIGNSKSKSEYEVQRNKLKKERDLFLENANNAQENFGNAVLDMFPYLFISKAVKDARKSLHLKIQDKKLPHGISKKLIEYLLQDGTTECICGNPLCEKEKEHIASYLKLLPPKSYASMYDEFSNTADKWGKGYNITAIEKHIKAYLDNNQSAYNKDFEIKNLDEQEKNNPDIEDLITDRANAEEKIVDLDKLINDCTSQLDKYNMYLKKQMREFDQKTKETEMGVAVQTKIDIMTSVYDYFSEKLDVAAKDYSEKLERNIQELLDSMLGEMRTVRVSEDFTVKVFDSHNDESKSEGQFAVVSFAYIGGILRMLQSEKDLSAKEYPLILDGPFSKLDEDYRQAVVENVPEFAPQVIIFSKDSLQDVFPKNKIGRVWTIQSNNEKNIASVKEGFLW